MVLAFAQKKSMKPASLQAKGGRTKQQTVSPKHVEQDYGAGVMGFESPVSAAVGVPVFQAKLKIGQPNDKYEQEADRVADAVMRMPDSTAIGADPADMGAPGLGKRPGYGSLFVQRMRTDCSMEEENKLQRKPLADNMPILSRISALNGPVTAHFTFSNNPSIIQRMEMENDDNVDELVQKKSTDGGSAVPAVTPRIETEINSLKGGGQPLSASTRAFFEPRFGVDFGGVRVHTDGRAEQMVKSVHAKAFTTGRNIVFGVGEYAPGSPQGKRLLGHELTHVVQQGGGTVSFSKGGNSKDTIRNSQESSVVSPKFQTEQFTGRLSVQAQPEVRSVMDNVVQRGEKWEQVKRVGPVDAWQAKKDADTALRASRMSGLPGLWNGPGDAFRHALWNCLMTRSIGDDQAKTVADTHEEFGKNHPNEKLMDDHNNAIGRLLGKKDKKTDCAEVVLGALKRGNLLIIPNFEAVQKSRGKISPDVPVNSKAVPIPKVDTDKLKYGKTGYAGSGYE